MINFYYIFNIFQEWLGRLMREPCAFVKPHDIVLGLSQNCSIKLPLGFIQPDAHRRRQIEGPDMCLLHGDLDDHAPGGWNLLVHLHHVIWLHPKTCCGKRWFPTSWNVPVPISPPPPTKK